MRVINTSLVHPNKNMLIIVSITLFISIITIYILIFNSKPNETNTTSSIVAQQLMQITTTTTITTSHHNITKHSLSNTNAKCIDGSSPVYYLRKGMDSGLQKWIIFFEGGGWCYNLEQCYSRSKTILGKLI